MAAKLKTPRPDDVLKLGQQNATLKANMPAKRWASFVKLAHARGHTIGGELSNQPAALKERTASSLKAEAQKSVATAYAPATKALSTREAAIGYLDQKRKTDDASYRTWLTGETDKLNAQAKAADATLASQQSTIATETQTAIDAARADSLKRMAATPGSVSDPTQSAALDTSAADTQATKHVQAARDQTAELTKIGGDARTLAAASVLAQQSAREATRMGDTWKALADVQTDRDKLTSEQAGATLDQTTSLIKDNAAIAQANREADLAGESLGVKKADLAQQITEANRKYKLDTKTYNLNEWKAQNAATVAQAKVDLGYDQIKSREGISAANRKLNEKLTKLRLADAKKDKTKSKGVTTAERDLYRAVNTVQGLFTRWDKNNAVPLAEREQHLRDMGYDDGTIAVARDLARNGGVLSPAARVKARKLGIVHSGYFWSPTDLSTGTGNPDSLNGLG